MRLAYGALTRERVAEAVANVATVPRADGAFYFLLDVHTRLRAMDVVERLVREYGVGVLPGDTFGVGGCSLRLAYGALTRERVAEAVGRLVRGLKGIVG